ERLAALERIAKREPDQENEYQQISDKLDAASTGLNDFYGRLYKLFSNSGDANNRLQDVKDREIPQLQAAIAETPRTVALYTLVSGDRYNVIVITGATPVARKYSIAEKDLNQKVAALGQAMRDPHSDPRPLAQD